MASTINLDSIINEVNLVTRNSAKSGKDYKLIQIILDNGMPVEFFPEKAEMYVIDLQLAAIKKT